MQKYKAIVAHGANKHIHSEVGGGYYMTYKEKVGVDPRTRSSIYVEHRIARRGITKDLAAVFWPGFTPQKAAITASSSSYKKKGFERQLSTVVGSVYSAVAVDKAEARKLKKQQRLARKRQQQTSSFKGRQNAMVAGLKLGKRVHEELHAFTSIMDLSENGFSNSSFWCKAVERFLSKNGSSGGIHACTGALLEFVRDACCWYPVAAEWCVGDFSPEGKYATQIDMIALYDHERAKTLERPPWPASFAKKILVCEVKTGYNDGSFELASGAMSHVRPLTTNAPVNQAKMQLVMSAAMFCGMYKLSWEDVELFVLWCPSKGTVLTPKVYPVSSEERDKFITALYTRNFL